MSNFMGCQEITAPFFSIVPKLFFDVSNPNYFFTKNAWMLSALKMEIESASFRLGLSLISCFYCIKWLIPNGTVISWHPVHEDPLGFTDAETIILLFDSNFSSDFKAADSFYEFFAFISFQNICNVSQSYLKSINVVVYVVCFCFVHVYLFSHQFVLVLI